MQSLQGQLLVAAPGLIDPNFRRTVVLITEHDADAAMGVVLNRPTAIEAADAVPQLADVTAPAERLFQGGPVQQESILALGEFRDPTVSAGLVFGAIGFVGADRDGDVVAGAVSRVRVFAGYAGWGPQQLEGELSEDAWIVAPAHPDDVFGERPGALWAAVLERLGGRYRLLARIPDDPRVN